MCRSRLEIKWIATVLAMAVFGWSSPVSFGQNGGGDGSQTVTLCHVPVDNPENAQTIVVVQSAAEAHLLHDDYLGPCLGDDGNADAQNQGGGRQGSGSQDETVIICHVPPGNPGNAHTLEVGAAAAEVHLAHGDFLGVCPGGPCLSDSDCDDGNLCNGIETCDLVAGCQLGTPLNCDDGNVCNGAETCDPASGCQDGTPLNCNDGNVCNGAETCNTASGCQDGTPLDCDDDNPCTDDSCDSATGCVNEPNTDACEDGNDCTTNDTCVDGECAGGAQPNCDDDDACTIDTCELLAGCVNEFQDADNDDVCDADDNCPQDANPDQLDGDEDGVGDACDPCPADNPDDTDDDGVCDSDDTCPGFDDNQDSDEDGIADGCDDCPNDADNDEDGDGVCGDVDQCPGTPPDTDVGSDGCPPGESQQQPPPPDEELCGVCGSGGEMSMAVMLMGLMLMRFGMRRRHS